MLRRSAPWGELMDSTKVNGIDELRHLLLQNQLVQDVQDTAFIDVLPVDEVRRAAVIVSRELARDLDPYWAASEHDGPIDVIDMFSGCGGMSAGFRAVNGVIPTFRIVSAVDIDRVANRSYLANIGLAPLLEDVSRLANSKDSLSRVSESRHRRNPLVLIGCAPCQGFSSHRNAAGQRDGRNSLFVDFAKVAIALEPEVVVVENVPELLTTRYWPYVREARRILESAGYQVHLGVHNMAEYGVPQQRYRALMLALRRPFRKPTGFLSRERFRTVREAIGHLPPIAAGQRHQSDPLHYTAGHQESTLATIKAVPKDGGNRPAGVGPESLRRIEQRQGRAAYEDVYGRLWWDRPSITVTAYARNPASGRFVHPEQDRGLSVREAAMLQGFPSTYWLEGTLDERFRQIGNAVAPPFAAALAAQILGELLATEQPRVPAGAGIQEPVGSSFSRLIPALKSGHRELYS